MNLGSSTVSGYLGEVGAALGSLPLDHVDKVLQSLTRAYHADAAIFIFGNGGSAATASHLALDLAKSTRWPGARAARVLSLNDHLAGITAYANDHGYSSVFRQQLEGLARPGDLAIGISASGNSPNVVQALTWARSAGLTTVGLLGRLGGQAARLAEFTVLAPVDSVDQQEDVHLVLAHIMTRHLKQVIRAVAEAEMGEADRLGRVRSTGA